MSKYAHIVGNKANLIVVEDNKVKELQDAGLTIIDISGIHPKPKSGWHYNPATKSFSEPAAILIEEQPVKQPVDMATMTQDDINKLLLEGLGYTIKE